MTGDCRIFDFDCDGDLDTDDETTLSNLYTGLSEDMRNRRIPSTTFSPAGNPFFHQGLVFDVEIDSYQNRARQYDPKLKRFMQRDPLAVKARARSGYQDGLNLYGYVKGNPVRYHDPMGLLPVEPIDGIESHRNRMVLLQFSCSQNVPVGPV